MPQPGGLNQQTVRLALTQQRIQPDLHRQTIHAAHTPARDLFHHRAAVGEQRAVDPHFAKFVDQHGPLFRRVFIGQQMQNGRSFTAAEKTGDQVGFGHVRSDK